MPSVYAIGDNAMPNDGHRLPATAQVASQMATYIAKALNKGDAEPFKWKNYGSMVFIGDYRVGPDVASTYPRRWWTALRPTPRAPVRGLLGGPRG